MRSAVVPAFRGVLEPGSVLGNQLFEELFKITPSGGIGILHQDQAAAGVTDEDGHASTFDPASRDAGRDLLGDLVSSFSLCRNDELTNQTRHSYTVTCESTWLAQISLNR